jgi:LTXXQ motif family protein
MRKTIISTLVTLSLAAAAMPLAVAQSATPSAARERPAHSQSAFKPSERAEARLAYVKTALKITDAQAPQWNAYANVVRKQAQQADQRMQERRSRMAAAQGAERKRPTAIERLERRQQFMKVALERSGERLAVQKPLYAALSPEQQRVADEVFAPRGQRGGHHRGGGRHGRA